MFKKFNPDITLIFIVICFMVLSTALNYSATEGHPKYDGQHIKHIAIYSVLFVFVLAASIIDFKKVMYPLSYFIYGFGVVLLIMVKFFGVTHHGATRWLSIPGVSYDIQPSEFMKLFLIIALARMLADRNGEPLRFVKDLLPLALLMFVPFYLILDQPDLGTALVFIAIMAGMVWVGNIRKFHALIISSVVVAAVSSVILLFIYSPETLEKVLANHQIERIETFIHPESDENSSYHIRQAKSAISTGQLSGQGFNNGYYSQGYRVPFTYSDSIFVVIAEEFGFVGAAFLLLLYFFLMYRMIHIALESKDLFSRYFIIGTVTMLSFQIFVNIGMHLGILPMTGISLPFVSYGGSALLLSMSTIAAVLSIKNHQSV